MLAADRGDMVVDETRVSTRRVGACKHATCLIRRQLRRQWLRSCPLARRPAFDFAFLGRSLRPWIRSACIHLALPPPFCLFPPY